MILATLRKVRTPIDFRRAVRPNMTAVGRLAAEAAKRARPFSRSYIHHILSGDYQPSDEAVKGLALWFDAHLRRDTFGRIGAKLVINGHWRITLVCAKCGRKWTGGKRSRCKCESKS